MDAGAWKRDAPLTGWRVCVDAYWGMLAGADWTYWLPEYVLTAEMHKEYVQGLPGWCVLGRWRWALIHPSVGPPHPWSMLAINWINKSRFWCPPLPMRAVTPRICYQSIESTRLPVILISCLRSGPPQRMCSIKWINKCWCTFFCQCCLVHIERKAYHLIGTWAVYMKGTIS